MNKLANDHNIPRSYTFMARTFLYLGYADVRGLTFVPDSTRIPVVEMTLYRENDLRAHLLKTLHDSMKEQPLLETDKIWDAVTPLAAIVFKRAATRGDISRQMANLRTEMSELRVRLKHREVAALGLGTRLEEQAALLKWEKVYDEIRHSFGAGESRVSGRALLNFGGALIKLGLNPLSVENWVKAFEALPIEAVRRLINRRPIVEIHRVMRDSPGTLGMYRDIKRLFGDISTP